MQKLFYTALLPLLINSVIAGDHVPNTDAEMERKLIPDRKLLSIKEYNDSADRSNTYPATEIDSPRSPTSSDLTILIKWRTKLTTDEDDPAIDCDEFPLFMSCSHLLTPYMKNHRSSYTEDQKTNLNLALTQIAEDFKSILPTKRYEITQQLNILAMFKGELTFTKTRGKRKKKTHVKVKYTLAERFRLGKNRRNPMQMQCGQIESGVITAEQATLTLYESWKTEGVLDQKVKSCKWRLKNNGFYQYNWPQHELIELLTIRAATPHVVKESTYSQDEIAKFCKRIRKKGRKKSQYIKNTAAPQLTKQWISKGVINEAIAECAERVAEANLWLAQLSDDDENQHTQINKLPLP